MSDGVFDGLMPHAHVSFQPEIQALDATGGRLSVYRSGLKICHSLLLHCGNEAVGQPAHSKAEQIVSQPILSENRRNDCVIADCIHRGRDTAGSLESHLAPGLLIELLDA